MIFVDVLIKDYLKRYYEDIEENYLNLENCNGSKFFTNQEKNEIESFKVKQLFSFHTLYHKVKDTIKDMLLTSYEDDIEEIVKLAIEDILLDKVSEKITNDETQQKEIYTELKSNFFIHFE